MNRVVLFVLCFGLLGFWRCSSPEQPFSEASMEAGAESNASKEQSLVEPSSKESASLDAGAETSSQEATPEATVEESDACGAGLTLCKEDCVDLQANSTHCGACGTVCGKGSWCVAGQCSTPTTMSNSIDDAMAAEMKAQGLVGLAVGVVKDGKVQYLKGYGEEDQDNKVSVVAEQTMFRWASISKTFAGIVAVGLEDEKKLDLDVTLQAYFSEYNKPTEVLTSCKEDVTIEGKTYKCESGKVLLPLKPEEQNITSRQLLGHLGGIPHYTNGVGNPTPPTKETNDPAINTGMEWAVKKYLMIKPLIGLPGQGYSYTTFGFNLLGVVLEKAGGQSFDAMVQARIAKPAGMTTLQPDYEWKKIPHRAVGYFKLGETIANQGSSDVSWKLAGGGYISTVRDMALYCAALTKTTVLSAAQKQRAWTRQKTTGGNSISYGLGFSIGRRNNRDYIGHSGSQQKTLTQLRLYPADNLCVVLMTNSTYAKTATLRNQLEDLARK
ncbi:MAG: serine hydrolase [Deltaproteobacteria bacterium]|nr:MAG: serine hydrolase [Deltaproteobacteria bacterium]